MVNLAHSLGDFQRFRRCIGRPEARESRELLCGPWGCAQRDHGRAPGTQLAKGEG